MTDWQLEEVPCDYCGSAEANVLLSGRDRLHGTTGEFDIVVCRQCGLARTSPRPALEDLHKAYPEAYSPHHEGRIRGGPPSGLLRWALVNFRGYRLGRACPAGARWLLWPLAAVALRRRRALRYIPFAGEGRLLDFGCGAGGYVTRMVAAGWQAEGLDFSAAALRAGRQAGLTLHEGTLPGADLPAESFDAITMWQAIEHVPSPMATLKAARGLLRPGGLLMIACPRIDWLLARWFGSAWYDLDLPRHLTHFSSKTLRRHVEAAGLAVAGFWAVRRPSAIRRSFAYLAADTGSGLHRRLVRSRMLAGLMEYAAWVARRTAQMYCLARRPP